MECAHPGAFLSLLALVVVAGCRHDLPRSGDAGLSSDAAPAACPSAMIAIPGGAFTPAHDKELVTLAPYCLDETEVTVDAYLRCMKDAACTQPARYAPDAPKMYGEDCNYEHPEDRRRHPVNCVDWVQAVAFCAWAGKRLPTDDEWEWAARGGDEGRQYPWGDGAPSAELLNACGAECVRRDRGSRTPRGHRAMYAGDDGFAGTAPVGSFPKGRSRFGALDLAGNVEEWTASRLETDAGAARLFRGGSFSRDAAEAVSTSARTAFHPELDTPVIGFRCAKTP